MIWSKRDIQNARKATLSDILFKRGYRLINLNNENFKVERYGQLIIKRNYWYWKNKKISGNTIDFFVKIEKMSFLEAMTIIMGKQKRTIPIVKKIQKQRVNRNVSGMESIQSILRNVAQIKKM